MSLVTGACAAISAAGIFFLVTQEVAATNNPPEPTVTPPTVTTPEVITSADREPDLPRSAPAARLMEHLESIGAHRDTPDGNREWLLPNLASQPPEDLLIEITDDGVRQLRFASIIGNTGIGPIETMPNDTMSCPAGQQHAAQIIYHDSDGDGDYARATDVETTVRPAGCMLYHPEHDHWHFDGAAWYVLTDTRSDQPIVSADKVSFCWRDNRAVESAAEVTYDQYYPVDEECGNGDVQGITPGWADVYSNELADQHLNLPNDLASGVYCLWNSADPHNLLVESDDTDNTAVTPFELIGIDVRVVFADDLCVRPPQLPG